MAKKTVLIKLIGQIISGGNGSGDEGSLVKLSAPIIRFIESGKASREEYNPLLLLSSRGGSAETAMSLYALLKQLPRPLTALGMGQIESAAIFVYLAAKKRLAMPTTTFMIHNGNFSMKDIPKDEIMSVARSCVLTNEVQMKVVAKECGLSLAQVRKWFSGGKSFSAKEAVKYGIVHEIVEDSVFKEMDEVLSIEDL